MRSGLARALLAGVLGLAAVEWVASAAAYRDRIDADEWTAAADTISTLPPGEPVFVANRWLSPRARSSISALSLPMSLAPASLHGAPTFHVLGFDGSRWSDELQVDLEDLPVPEVVQRRQFGDLTLTTYALRSPTLVHDFTADEPDIEARGRRCVKGGAIYKCGMGRMGQIEQRVVEVDYRPRYCFSIDLPDGVETVFTLRPVPEARSLRGHLGFSDFNGRLRSDGPATVTLERAGSRLGQWVISDEQGWFPFAVDVEPSPEPITLRVASAVQGTWQRAGYDRGRGRSACVELRAFGEAP